MAYRHDYSTWTPEEREFALENPDIAAAYDAGKLKFRPRIMIQGMTSGVEIYEELQAGTFSKEDMMTLAKARMEGLDDEVAKYGHLFGDMSMSKFDEWVVGWKQEYLDIYDRMVAAGMDRSKLDPTPWDEETEEDKAVMQQYLLEELEAEEQERIAEEQRLIDEQNSAIVAAEQEAINADLDTIDRLSTLRAKSEMLAAADVDDYIARTTQYLKLRGVVPGFTEEKRDELITSRFTDYWSQENEEQLINLSWDYANKGYDLPEISDRVWRKGDLTLQPITNLLQTTQTVLSAAGSSPVSNLLSILDEDADSNTLLF